MKKIVISLVAAVLLMVSVVGFAACDVNAKVSEKYSYVSLKINPEVDFVVDGSGKVVSYFCVNEDAEVLLSDENLNGQSVEDATEKVLDLAVRAGYIDVNTLGDEIEVGVVNGDGTENTEVFEKLEKNLNEYFENNGIYGCVSKATLDSYLAQAEELGLSVGHVKILMLAIDRSGKTLDELKDLPTNELMNIIHQNNCYNSNGNGHGNNMHWNGNNSDSSTGNNSGHGHGHGNNYDDNYDRTSVKNQKIQDNQNNINRHHDEFENDREHCRNSVRNWQNK